MRKLDDPRPCRPAGAGGDGLGARDRASGVSITMAGMSSRAVKTEAVVLRSMRYGEADRILHLYTPHRGRVSAIAKGVRRARSRFGGRLEPFFRLHIELHEGRGELLTVTGAQTIDGHARLRGDARALDAAARACDAVGRLFETSEPHPGVFNLLCRQLALLDELARRRARTRPRGRPRWRACVSPEAAAGGGPRAAARRVRELRRARAPGGLLGRGRGRGVRGVRGGLVPARRGRARAS